MAERGPRGAEDAGGAMFDAALAPQRRERSAEQTKKRLLDAAESEFAAKGFDGARLSAIARVAGVQQQLVHHYFGDKAGLYRAVVARGMEAMATEGWSILERLAPARSPRSKKRMSADDARALVAAFVDLLVDFYATHGALLLILRHDADSGGALAGEIVGRTIRPQFDAVCSRIEAMAKRGEIQRSVDAKQLCTSAIAMCSYPYVEERFFRIAWPIDPRDPAFIEARKHDIVQTLLARMLV